MKTDRNWANSSKAEYGSDVLVDLMKSLDIEYIAMNPGASFRELHDSIVNYGGNQKPEVILCCHEEIAVDIAHGYNKVAAKPMVAIVHDTIGLLHATMAIFNDVPYLIYGFKTKHEDLPHGLPVPWANPLQKLVWEPETRDRLISDLDWVYEKIDLAKWGNSFDLQAEDSTEELKRRVRFGGTLIKGLAAKN